MLAGAVRANSEGCLTSNTAVDPPFGVSCPMRPGGELVRNGSINPSMENVGCSLHAPGDLWFKVGQCVRHSAVSFGGAVRPGCASGIRMHSTSVGNSVGSRFFILRLTSQLQAPGVRLKIFHQNRNMLGFRQFTYVGSVSFESKARGCRSIQGPR